MEMSFNIAIIVRGLKEILIISMFKLLFLLPLITLADEYNRSYIFTKLGFGMFNSALSSSFETKCVSLGYQRSLGDIFVWSNEIGALIDPRNDIGRSSSFMVKSMVGPDLQINWFYIQPMFGIAYLSNTDSYLGTNFNFTESLGVGVRDKKGTGVGFEYNHMSNAGLSSINVGRDTLSLKISIPIGFDH